MNLFDDLCRTCTTKSTQMLNLFGNCDDDKTLADKIFICTQVYVNNQIDRPSKMCQNCALHLEQSYEFHKLVKSSEKIFQQMLSPTRTKIDTEAEREIIDDPMSIPIDVLDIKVEEDEDENISSEPTTTESSLPEIRQAVNTRPVFKKERAKSIIIIKASEKCEKNRKHKTRTEMITKRNKNIRNREFECYKCKLQFPSFWKTSVHLKQHDAEEKFKCIVCGNRFILWQEFNQHLCQGSDIKCSYCDETFVATIALLNHLEKSHDEKTLFKCEKCAQFYSMSLLRQYHIMIQHADIESEDSKQFVCNVCEKRFATKYALRSHEEIHSDEKPFLCFECGKRFKTSSSLHTHRICHTEKTLKCPDCPMTFNRIAGFRKHRDVHLNLKYKCNLCQAELRSKDALERHTRRHRLTDDDKRHQCTFCPMKFFKRDKLTRHIRTHTGEKPFKCPFCSDRAYAQKGDLTKHIKLKHVGNKIYNCEICQDGFQYYADLKTHSFEHYKEEKAKQQAIP